MGTTATATPTPPPTTTASVRLRPTPLCSTAVSTATAVSTTATATAASTIPTPPPTTATTSARGRLRPSPTMAMAIEATLGPTPMAALDTTVEKANTWTTAFHNYIPRPKTITTKNLFHQNLHHKTGCHCQTKRKKHVKVQTAMLIVSPSSIK